MRTSVKTIMTLPCGHAAHSSCVQQLIQSSSTFACCPQCRKTIDRNPDYERRLAHAIATAVMPEPLNQLRVEVFCADCEKHSVRSFNYYGAMCQYCNSPNTTEVRRLEPNEQPSARVAAAAASAAAEAAAASSSSSSAGAGVGGGGGGGGGGDAEEEEEDSEASHSSSHSSPTREDEDEDEPEASS